MKIRIIGQSASGKSTLARLIAKKYKLEHVDLDPIIFPHIPGTKKRVKNKREVYEKFLKEKVKKNSWVIEGIWTLKDTIEKADHIIFLNIPLHTLIYRLWKRYFFDEKCREKYSFLSTVRLTWKTIEFSWKRRGRSGLRKYIKLGITHEDDIVKNLPSNITHIRSKKDWDSLISSLSSSSSFRHSRPESSTG